MGLRKPRAMRRRMFDDAVDGFGAAVAGPSGGEVGEELLPPGGQCAAEPGDLGNGAAGE